MRTRRAIFYHVHNANGSVEDDSAATRFSVAGGDAKAAGVRQCDSVEELRQGIFDINLNLHLYYIFFSYLHILSLITFFFFKKNF